MTAPPPKSPAPPEEPRDDQALVSFLRTYAPEPPPAKSMAETQLMQAIATQPLSQKQSRRWRTGPWLMGLGLLIGLGAGLGQLGRWLTAPPTEELAGLETFLVGNWSAATQVGEAEQDWDWLIFGKKPDTIALNLTNSLSNSHLFVERKD